MREFLSELMMKGCRALLKQVMRMEGIEPGSLHWKQQLWLLENDPEKLSLKKEEVE